MKRRALASSLLLLAVTGPACSGRVLDLGGDAGSRSSFFVDPGNSSGTSGGSGSGPGSSSGSGPSAGILGGSGYFTVVSDVPTAGAKSGSYTASVVFTSDYPSPEAERTIGACVVRPTYIEPIDDNSGVVGAPRPTMGNATISGGNVSLVFQPDAHGFYPAQKGTAPAWAGGDVLSFAFSSAPRGVDTRVLKAPQYVALQPTSAFAARSATIPRTSDLALSWTADLAPAADDRVMVDLRVASGAYFTRVLCSFDANAKQGIISADALQALGAGAGSYSVTSAHAFSVVSNYEWHLNYVLASHARSADGLAAGAVTFE